MYQSSKCHQDWVQATLVLVGYEDEDVEASSATGIDGDGDDEHITVSLELVEHIVVHVTVSLEMVVEHITVSLGLGSTSQCSWRWRSTSQCPGW